MDIFRRFWLFKHLLGSYQWYRRWHGGRWEYRWIEICGSFIWLGMHPDLTCSPARVVRR